MSDNSILLIILILCILIWINFLSPAAKARKEELLQKKAKDKENRLRIENQKKKKKALEKKSPFCVPRAFVKDFCMRSSTAIVYFRCPLPLYNCSAYVRGIALGFAVVFFNICLQRFTKCAHGFVVFMFIAFLHKSVKSNCVALVDEYRRQ